MRTVSLIALLLTAMVSAKASDFVKDGIYYTYDIDAMTARVCVCDDYDNPPSGDIVIPATVTMGRHTFDVVAIDQNAFANAPITSVTIEGDAEHGVTSIGRNAFSYCLSLERAVISDRVKEIDKQVFYECSALKSVRLPDGLELIPNALCLNCTSLTTFNFPKACRGIDDEAFRKCGFTELHLPDNIILVGEDAFAYNKKLTKVDLGNGLKAIDYCAFQGCPITEITLPPTLQYLLDEAFASTKLTRISLPPSLIMLGPNTFAGCKLKEIIYEDGDQDLEFMYEDPLMLDNYDPAIESVYLGRNLNAAPYDYEEERVRHLTIGPLVKNLNFQFGDALETVTSYIADPTAVPEYFTNRVHANAILYVPQEYLSAYENAATWKRFFDIRPIAEDAVGAIAADSRAAERYDLSGRRLPATAAPHGISIIRQADGSARKVLSR